MRFHVGMSGWTFPGWRAGFYPKGLPQKQELAFASRQVTSIEINGTFYRVQKPESFESWYKASPDGFVLSVKAPKFITHIRRLVEVESAVANFFASGLLRLKEKLGPILWQFPPNVMLKDDRFEKFLKFLPKDPAGAARVAKKHSDWMKGRSYLSAAGVPRIRHAMEFRHPSFFNRDFLQMLRAHNVAVVFAHGGDAELFTQEPTADFVYCRMHGEGKGYAKGYPQKTSKAWASALRSISGVQDAFVYFDTENKKYAPCDAQTFLGALEKPAMPRRAASRSR